MFECKPSSVGKSKLMVGDMRSLDDTLFRKLSMKMQSADGDWNVTLIKVAFVPGARFHLLSLHGVMPTFSTQ